MRVLLDTQIFLVLAQQGTNGLSLRQRKLVEDEGSDLLVSAISITEIAIKASINKLTISASAVLKAVDDLRVIEVPFESRHAIRMFNLPLHHRDPFDRMLIATALAEGVPILSHDNEFKRYRDLKLIS